MPVVFPAVPILGIANLSQGGGETRFAFFFAFVVHFFKFSKKNLIFAHLFEAGLAHPPSPRLLPISAIAAFLVPWRGVLHSTSHFFGSCAVSGARWTLCRCRRTPKRCTQCRRQLRTCRRFGRLPRPGAPPWGGGGMWVLSALTVLDWSVQREWVDCNLSSFFPVDLFRSVTNPPPPGKLSSPANCPHTDPSHTLVPADLSPANFFGILEFFFLF